MHTEQPDKNNRFSSSSDEPEQVDTSDEMLELDNMDINDRFIADCAREAVAAAAISSPNEEKDQAQVNKARQKAEDMIRKAEMKWAQLLATPGKYPQVVINEVQLQNPGALTPMQLSSMVDERYLVIGSHLDPSLQEIIKTGQYVDFA